MRLRAVRAAVVAVPARAGLLAARVASAAMPLPAAVKSFSRGVEANELKVQDSHTARR
jgi:hypothetical protein